MRFPTPCPKAARSSCTSLRRASSPRSESSFGVPILIAGIALIVSGCQEPPLEPVDVVRPVKIHTMGATQEAGVRQYPGTIRAFQNAEMGFEVQGRIQDFLVREGDLIEKGQVMARLDPRDYQSELNVAKANLTKAEADLKRSTSVFEQDPGAISKDTIDANQRAVDVAVAQMAIAQKALEDTELVAHFDGVMARKLVEDFQNVQAKEPVLILQDNSVLEIWVDIPERDIAGAPRALTVEDINEAISPEVVVSAIAFRSFDARVREFATTADPVTRTFNFRLNFDRPDDANILPGMTARVQVVTDPNRAWSVPVTAAQADDAGQSFVWRIDPESMIVNRAPVELGEMYSNRVLIESGVEEGELVAISGVTQLRDGMKVRKFEN